MKKKPSFQRLPDQAVCRCDEPGRFCPSHGVYGRPATEGYRDEVDKLMTQRCGGGRRIVRKRIGGDNY